MIIHAVEDDTTMLKKTVAAVEESLRQRLPAETLQATAAIRQYAALGEGGAQTVAQYVAMLMKLMQ